ncbi:MAG: shikimate kinase [Myxococcota bacterium]
MPATSAIYLIGMMGVGKSTIGELLAARLGRIFIDTDREIEKQAGQRISEIFETQGEAGFRRIEAQVVSARVTDGSVIALGGGAVAQSGVIERLLAEGEVIFLTANPDVLLARIGDPSGRPLLAGLDPAGRVDRLARLLEERLPFYLLARVTVDASGTAEQTVDRIIDALAGVSA